MKKNLINLSIKEKEYVENLINHNKNPKAQLKAKVILLKSLKNDISTIMIETGLSKRTIINYTNEYINSGYSRQFFFKANYNKSKLNKYTELIVNEFREKPPLSYSEGTLRIEKLTGMKRSQTQARKFLNSKRIYTRRTKITIDFDWLDKRRLNDKFKARSKANN
jgi:hypothetical protein